MHIYPHEAPQRAPEQQESTIPATANKSTAYPTWITLQELRNLTGLSEGQLRQVRKLIGHVPERGDGARKCIKRKEFFQAWLKAKRQEDEIDRRKRIALADRAEREAELARIAIAKKQGELMHVDEMKADNERITTTIREALERAAVISPDAVAVIEEALEKLKAEIQGDELGE